MPVGRGGGVNSMGVTVTASLCLIVMALVAPAMPTSDWFKGQ